MFKKDTAIYATFALQLVLFCAFLFIILYIPFGAIFGPYSDSRSPLPQMEMLNTTSVAQTESMGDFSKNMRGGAADAAPAPFDAPGSLLTEVAEANDGASTNYLVKTGNIRGRVDSLKETRKDLAETIKTHKAQIESENQSRYNQSINLDIKIKVPSSGFEALMSDLAKHANYLDNKSSQVVDKFKQFTDLESNIKNQTLLRQRYRKILSDAKKVKDLLEIERELANVQRRIDNYTRQLEHLKDLISRSTISASFYEQLPLSKQKNQISFLRQFSNSFVKGLSRTKSFFLWLISLWPFVLIIGGLVYYFVRRKRG